MLKPKVKAIRAWGLYFKHSLSWVYFDSALDRTGAKALMKQWKLKSPDWEYKIVPVLITPLTKKK